MSKKMVSFMPGESETDDVVRRWLTHQGIDERLISGYSIFRHQGEVPRIMLEMYFDDAPPATGGDVPRETKVTIGEQGPEPISLNVKAKDPRDSRLEYWKEG